MSDLNTALSHYRVDRLDLGILECLALNCRLAHSTIGEALAVASNTVSNRILNLEREGILRHYVMMCDLRPFGFTRNHVLLKFSSKGHDLYAQCQALSKAPSAIWIPSYIGVYDLQVIVESHDQLPMSDILLSLFKLCPNNLLDYAIFTEMVDLEFTHRLPILRQNPHIKFRDDGSFAIELAQPSTPLPLEFQRQKISALDVKLLECLADNPRAALSTLAETIKCDRQTVRRRLLNLIHNRIILSFGVGLDYQRLGYTAYHLLFRLRPGLALETLQKTFKGFEGVYYAGTAHGAYDLSVYLHASSAQQLGLMVQKIRKAFGAHITHYDLLVYDKVHYWKQFSSAVVQVLGQEL